MKIWYAYILCVTVVILNSLANSSELFSTQNYKTCKQNCIDAGHIFCPNSTDNIGSCCDILDQDTCPKEGVCSNDTPIRSEGLKYWTCPH